MSLLTRGRHVFLLDVRLFRYFLRTLPFSWSASFTLLELLITIGIIAIISVIVLFTLNPFDLLKQVRDTNRLSDLTTLTKTISAFVSNSGGSGNLGDTTKTYLSLIDPSATTTAGTDCASLGFDPGYFHCPASSTAANVDGTGWIPINLNNLYKNSPVTSLPLDPINTASSHLYYSYFPGSGNFKLVAMPESSKYLAAAVKDSRLFRLSNNDNLGGGPGWALVPGNPDFGTQNFWVMKYDAKCVMQGTSAGLTAPDGGIHTYNDSAGGSACTSANSRGIASVPDGYPIGLVSHDTAKTYCASIGAHLLTNDEYMTIVRNAEQIDSNWTGNSVGSGALYSGHNDSDPFYVLPASLDDTDGYYGTGNVAPSNQRRTFTLSNGSVVWDLAGNILQHVQRSVMNTGDLTTSIYLPSCSSGGGWSLCEYGNSGNYVSGWSSDVAQDKVSPSGASWNSSQGMGTVYTWASGSNQYTQVFARSGSFSYNIHAGAFALDLHWFTNSAVPSLGFRCAR